MKCGHLPKSPPCHYSEAVGKPHQVYPKVRLLSHHSFHNRGASGKRLLAAAAIALLSAALVIVLANALRQAPAAPQMLIEQQTVETVKPSVCVHSLLENEVQEEKILRSLALTRELGTSTIVQFFPWAYFEQSDDDFSWERADFIIKHARLQGLHIIARLGLVPEWARRGISGSTLNTLPSESFADFAEYAAAFAARYAGEVEHIIIWNEPNLSFEWGYQPVDPADYANLLKATYARVKAANAQMTILAGALAPTLEAAGSSAGWNDLAYLRALYAAGASAYFDALAIHSYGFLDPPEAPPAANRLNFRRAELLRGIMLEYGDAAKPAFITESGWNDHPRWTGAVRPSQRSAYTIRAFQFAEANWSWLERLCIWALRYPANLNAYPDYSTLISPDFQLKPIYYALQAYARGWESETRLWLPPPEKN